MSSLSTIQGGAPSLGRGEGGGAPTFAFCCICYVLGCTGVAFAPAATKGTTHSAGCAIAAAVVEATPANVVQLATLTLTDDNR